MADYHQVVKSDKNGEREVQFTFRGMSINNDAMVATTSAIAVYLIIGLVKRGFTPKRGIVTSIVIAAAFLSKINAIALLVPFTLAILTKKGRWLERLVTSRQILGVWCGDHSCPGPLCFVTLIAPTKTLTHSRDVA
jgi:hypothetical protein